MQNLWFALRNTHGIVLINPNKGLPKLRFASSYCDATDHYLKILSVWITFCQKSTFITNWFKKINSYLKTICLKPSFIKNQFWTKGVEFRGFEVWGLNHAWGRFKQGAPVTSTVNNYYRILIIVFFILLPMSQSLGSFYWFWEKRRFFFFLGFCIRYIYIPRFIPPFILSPWLEKWFTSKWTHA